jgi:hypothetical protein
MLCFALLVGKMLARNDISKNRVPTTLPLHLTLYVSEDVFKVVLDAAVEVVR